MLRILVATLAVLPLSAFGADLPAKAPIPFVLGYSGSGFYKFIGTGMEADKAQTALGDVSSWGAMIKGGAGYQWATSAGSFTALEVSCAYHNVGGSNLVGSITSRWSCDQVVKFGGNAIASLFNWIPTGFQFPTLPNLGTATGGVHPYVGVGVREQDAHADVLGATRRHIDAKGFLQAGMLQQYCKDASGTSCVTTDTGVSFQPKQQGFSVFGQQQNIGNSGRVFLHVAF